jgi:hypothetical protein
MTRFQYGCEQAAKVLAARAAGTKVRRDTREAAPWSAVDQPIVIDGHAVTFWGPVSSDGDEYATIAEVAASKPSARSIRSTSGAP